MSMITPDDEVRVDAYDKPLVGFYGEFKTTNSHPISFFQTSIPIERIDLLKTAGDALEPEHFKELIQRDINEERVIEIVDEYLKRKDIVLFFPPLIASVIAHDDNKTVSTYENSTHESINDGKAIASEWGERFRVSIPTDTRDTGYKYRGENSKPYFANLEIKPDKVHLVVIDGQHRLTALKKLKEHDPELCAKMDIPVCIIYPPNAVEGNENSETITTAVRELFVRINNEGKRVSGHFITLLKDGDITAITMREICEYAKKHDLKNGASLLNLIEWNERNDKRASQLNKQYSLTSVGILATVFKEFGFGPRHGIPSTLLHLKSKESELSSREPYLNIDEINSDAIIPATQFDALEQLAKENIAPGLVVLFTQPKPYKDIIEAFEKAIENLDKDISDQKRGAKKYKELLVKEFREVNEYDRDSVQDARVQFTEQVASHLGRTGTEYSIYQYSVFQQGYIRAWISMCKKLSQFYVENETTAKFLVQAAEKSTFNLDIDLFNNSKNYNELTLYKNQKIQQSARAKNLWESLVLASLLNPDSQRTLKSILEEHFDDSKKSDEALTVLNEQLFKIAFDEFSNKRKNLNREHFLNNWRTMEDTIDAENFEKLIQLEAKKDDESDTKLVELLEHLSDSRYKDVREKLKSAIGI